MIVLAVLIAFDCFDLVAEIMIEQEIRGENFNQNHYTLYGSNEKY